MNIAIRVDSSVKIGTGHVMRCMTLADSLRKNGAEVLFICREHDGNVNQFIIANGYNVEQLNTNPKNIVENRIEKDIYKSMLGTSEVEDAKNTIEKIRDFKPSWVIVDHYSLGIKWEQIIKKYTNKIFVVDDLANRRHDCDVLLDQNLYENMYNRYNNLIPRSSKRLFGPKYAILRNEFINQRKDNKIANENIKSIFIFFGGTDHFNLTEITLRSLMVNKLSQLNFNVVIGKYNPNKASIQQFSALYNNINLVIQTNEISKIMAKSDVAIGSGGSAIWEMCCLGLPSFIISFADNQLESVRHLSKNNIIEYHCHFDELKPAVLAQSFYDFITDNSKIKSIKRQCFGLVDGFGKKRIMKEFLFHD